jgi:membrane protein required for colicin V production
MAIVKGLRRGLIIALCSVIAFVVGIAAAMKLSVVVAGYLKDSVNVSVQWLPVISFILVFVAVVLLIRLGAKMLEKTVELAALGWINRLAGVLFYAMLYMLGFSVLLFYAQQVHLVDESTADRSLTYSVIQPWGPLVINTFGKLIPLFKDMFTELEQFFARIAQHAAQ